MVSHFIRFLFPGVPGIFHLCGFTRFHHIEGYFDTLFPTWTFSNNLGFYPRENLNLHKRILFLLQFVFSDVMSVMPCDVPWEFYLHLFALMWLCHVKGVLPPGFLIINVSLAVRLSEKFQYPPSATLCLFLLWNRSCHFFPLYGLGFLAPLSHPCQNGYVSLTKFNLAVDAFTHRWHRFEMATSPSLRQKGIAVRHRSTLSHRCFNFVFLSLNFCGSKRNKS